MVLSYRSLESLGVRVQRKDVVRIFDKLDTEEMGLIAHDDFVARLFGGAGGSKKIGGASVAFDERVDSDVRVALRKRPDLLEEIILQLRAIEAKSG